MEAAVYCKTSGIMCERTQCHTQMTVIVQFCNLWLWHFRVLCNI